MDKEQKLRAAARIARTLNAHEIDWAVGASMLLYFKGVVPDFGDIDLTVTEQDAFRAKRLLAELGESLQSAPNGQYQTTCFAEFIIDGVEVDLMAGMKIWQSGVLHDCSFYPTHITEIAMVEGECVPLGSIERWREYYSWMGRTQKVEMIDSAALGNGRFS